MKIFLLLIWDLNKPTSQALRKTRDEIENFLSLCNIFYSLKHHLMQIVWGCLCHKARVGKGNDSIIRREAPGCK